MKEWREQIMVNRIRLMIMMAMDSVMVTFISLADMAHDRHRYFED